MARVQLSSEYINLKGYGIYELTPTALDNNDSRQISLPCSCLFYIPIANCAWSI
jgi:hypothetical protein